MLVSTPSIVLHAFSYGETSKIVRLATRDHGVQSVIAKGATRPKSRFGASLQLLSEGIAHFYLKAHRDLHTLSAFDLTAQRNGLASDLGRYAAASALAELVMRFSPAEPHPEVFAVLHDALELLARADRDATQVVALAALWRTVGVLGFAPSVESCARCGRTITDDARFSVSDGGLLCGGCGATIEGGTLDRRDQAALLAFLSGSTGVPDLPENHLAAHRRLLARFVRRHLAEERELKALAFWESGP